jgi:hypothetical protein
MPRARSMAELSRGDRLSAIRQMKMRRRMVESRNDFDIRQLWRQCRIAPAAGPNFSASPRS